MTIQIELSPETEVRLAAAARIHGLPPGEYAGTLLDEILSSSVSGTGKLSVEELHHMLEQIAEGSAAIPDLPTSTFSRESFYEWRPE